MDDIADLLDAGGPLAAAIEGFQSRREQQDMAQAVAAALDERRALVVEAGTGTGKTFAYLAPALLSGQKVLVSTGTKNLQDQLFHKDLPAVRAALGVPVEVALLKGRANYLCLQRLEQARHTGRFDAPARAEELRRIERWSHVTPDGDIAGIEGVPEDSSIWPWVTSTADNCLGVKCAHYDDCHVLIARRRALAADIVVINHHLLFADLQLKESGFGDLLPGADAIIIDEAHQIPETAQQFFGTSVSSRALLDLMRVARAAAVNDAPDTPGLRELPDALDLSLKHLILAVAGGSGSVSRDSRTPWDRHPDLPGLRTHLADTRATLLKLAEGYEAVADRAPALMQIRDRAWSLVADLDHLNEEARSCGPRETRDVRWIETFPQGFALHRSPLDLSGPLGRLFLDPPRSWVFTSATLAVGDDFSHFTRQVGLEDVDTLQLGSPFDYEHNALLYVPEGLPEPSDRGFTHAVLEAALPVIAAAGGRTFMLFTSHRALRQAADFLEGRFAFPLLVQGSAPRDALLREFRERGDAVLLGTGSFWEGVDVRGGALSLVIIDKLPFAAPDDPILAARIEAINAEGGNAFMQYQVPRAVIALKQGVGRLIRDVADTGVMIICDPRLVSKPYGRIFLRSLPPMTRTRDPAEVVRFLNTRT